ncbi:MAG: helix-turn-helix domain-containing protein [Sphingomonadales bacterium]|nr:helix-turn-helix domain-containing protein [Sphingomonadales bacterium]
MASEDRPQSPQSVTRVIGILERLAASEVPVSLADLSRALATPKSSLVSLLRGLADEHFVVAVDGAWRLGPGAFGLGSALMEARRRFTTSDLVREGMRRLAERTGETVLFAVRDGDGQTMTYVDVIESRNAVRFAISIGDRRPLYGTAGGRALLAAASEADVAAYLATITPQAFTAETVTAIGDLAAAVAAARASGVAQTVNQAGDGVTGTAAAIRDASGAALGALVVAAPSSRLTGSSPDLRAELVRLVREEAVAVSRSLGHRPSGQ